LRSNGAYAPFGRNRRTQAREMIAEGFIVAGYVVEIRSRVYIAGCAKYLYGYLSTYSATRTKLEVSAEIPCCRGC
jgi:hypothetical protein